MSIFINNALDCCFPGRKTLTRACLSGDVGMAMETMGVPRDAMKKDPLGNIPVMCAASEGHVKVLEYLLENGVPHGFYTRDGWTLLHEAVESGKIDAIKFLLDRDASLSRRRNSRGRTPIHMSVLSGDVDSLEAILEHRGVWDISPKDSRGTTPLMESIKTKNAKMSKLLYARGASFFDTDNDGNNGLYFARVNGMLPMVHSMNVCRFNPKTGIPVSDPVDIPGTHWKKMTPGKYSRVGR